MVYLKGICTFLSTTRSKHNKIFKAKKKKKTTIFNPLRIVVDDQKYQILKLFGQRSQGDFKYLMTS